VADAAASATAHAGPRNKGRPCEKNDANRAGSVPSSADATARGVMIDDVSTSDLSTICPDCGNRMSPEHAHYRCRFCGYRDTCCDGAPAGASCGTEDTHARHQS
jgi:hypothetical protein